MDYNKYVTKMVNETDHDFIISTRQVSNTIKVADDVYMITYNPNVSKYICNEFGLDFIAVLNTNKFEEGDNNKTYKSVSIPIASAVLAYARIYMAKIKQYILNNNGEIYYTDTDSIVTNIELPDYMVDPKIIGKFKLEHKVIQGYFISNKTYFIKTSKGENIKIAKGVNSDTLTLKSYRDMYNNVPVKAIKTSSKKSLALGSVSINDIDVVLDPASYTKRTKIFNSTGK